MIICSSTAKHFFSVAPPDQEIARKALNKGQPYRTGIAPDHPTISYNCDIALEHGGLLECRHLAALMIKETLGDPDGKMSWHHVGSQDAFCHQVSTHGMASAAEFDAMYNAVLRTAGHRYLIHCDDFGAFLYRQSEHLAQMPKHQRIMLLESENHAMVLSVRYKQGRQQYVVTLFDPNFTLSQVRVEVTERAQLCDLTLAQLLSPDEYALNFPGDEKLCMLHDMTTPTTESVVRSLDARPSTGLCSSQAVGALLTYGCATDLALALPEVLTRRDRLTILAAKDAEGNPGLFYALQEGHAAAVYVFTKTVIQARELPDEAKADLMAARCPNGAPGLFLALQNGHATTVQVFLDAVFCSTLADDIKMALIAAKRADGAPGLFLPLQHGHATTVQVFLDAVFCSTLSDDIKMALIAAKCADGAPGLFLALQNGHATTVQVFLDTVLRSALSEENKVNLIAAKDIEGTPGVFPALQYGHTNVVLVFLDTVFRSALSEENKVNLIAAKDIEGTPGLFLALRKGQENVVAVFLGAVSRSTLSNENKVKLMAAKCGTGTSGLSSALKRGQAKTVTAYINGIDQSGLSDTEKMALMAGQNSHGTPGLRVAIAQGHTETVNAYRDAVNRSHLSDEQKAALLAV